MRSLIILGALLVSFSSASAEARSIDYFLPSGTSYDESITTPREFLGYEVGEWHLRHDQLVAYLKRLSDESPRLTFEETGRTHEHRPLVMVTVTSPNNHERLDEIQKQHLQLGDPASDAKPDASWPVIVNMGYSVHGCVLRVEGGLSGQRNSPSNHLGLWRPGMHRSTREWGQREPHCAWR